MGKILLALIISGLSTLAMAGPAQDYLYCYNEFYSSVVDPQAALLLPAPQSKESFYILTANGVYKKNFSFPTDQEWEKSPLEAEEIRDEEDRPANRQRFRKKIDSPIYSIDAGKSGNGKKIFIGVSWGKTFVKNEKVNDSAWGYSVAEANIQDGREKHGPLGDYRDVTQEAKGPILQYLKQMFSSVGKYEKSSLAAYNACSKIPELKPILEEKKAFFEDKIGKAYQLQRDGERAIKDGTK